MTSLIFGVSGALDMLLFYPAGKVMDRFGRLWVAVPSMLTMAVGLAVLPLAHTAPRSRSSRRCSGSGTAWARASS